MAVPDELLTPKELAARLKVCESTVYREQSAGLIPGRLVRGKLRFSWPEVLRALPAAPAKDRDEDCQSNDLVWLLKSRVKSVKLLGAR